MFEFYKYQGTGNDFILIDEWRGPKLPQDDPDLIARLCHRRFGIGADGLMLLRPHDQWDFEMVYFNADGQASSMCGNGGRCIAAFAHRLGYVDRHCQFLATDGPHRAEVNDDGVRLEMRAVKDYQRQPTFAFLNTGSPHYVEFVPNVDTCAVVKNGRRIRHDPRFAPGGTNVNFVERRDEHLYVATYERGVEDETFSCGTGVTAAALADHLDSGSADGIHRRTVVTKGGILGVQFTFSAGEFKNIWLSGPAVPVFHGVFAS